MYERQGTQMKNELEKFAVGAGTACTVVLSELFFVTGTGCTGICGNCGGTCAGGIIPGLGILGGYLYKKAYYKVKKDSKNR
jgi:hypothetical protein